MHGDVFEATIAVRDCEHDVHMVDCYAAWIRGSQTFAGFIFALEG